MRKFIEYAPLFPVIAAVVLSVFTHSCANTTQAPTGGLKDTIPPLVLKVTPALGSTLVPVHDTRITFTFNEYVTVKDPKSIYLSPSQAKSPKYKLKGKDLVVYFEEDLLPNTTYTLDLTNAVADNNEGNIFPGFTAVFSTGESVDSMYLTGSVYDCTNLKPIKGATVMLYKDQSDSAVFLRRPDASAKTDDWGYFSLRNIQDTVFRAYAIVDNNGDNLYNPEEDRIAFLDSLVRPSKVVNDTVPELGKHDMKDTLACLSRISELNFNVFREKPSKQMLMSKVRLSDRASYITFMAPGARIDSLWFKGFPASKVITEFNIQQDSLLLWLNDQRRMPDTLQLCVKYWKTDSLGTLRPETETVSLVDEKKPKGKQPRRQISHQDTTCTLKLEAAPETIEQKGIDIIFDYPPVIGEFDSLLFKSINPKQVETKEKFKIKRDSLNLRRYVVTPEVQLLHGYEYVFKVPHRVFKDINGFWNDSTEVKVTLPDNEEISSLTLNCTGVRNKYIIDLQDGNKGSVLRSFTIDSDKALLFPYLKAGRYVVRITEDINRNGVVDTGDLLSRRQPEKVKYLKIDKKEFIEIPARSEVVQDISLSDFFNSVL